MGEDPKMLLLTFGGLALFGSLGAAGHIYGDSIRPGAGPWLALTVVVVPFAILRWRLGDYRDMPGAIRVAAVVLLAAIVGRTVYLLAA